MVPVFNRNSKELVSNLSERIDQGPVDVFPYTMDMSLKSVCRKFPTEYTYYIRNLYLFKFNSSVLLYTFFSAFDLEIELRSYRSCVYTIYTIVKIIYITWLGSSLFRFITVPWTFLLSAREKN